MKTSLLFLGILSLITFQLAHADDDPTLAQQLQVTQDAIQKLIRELNEQKAAGGLNASDYKRWAIDFNVSIENALQKYENRLKNTVFKALTYSADRYNSIVENNSIPDSQKEIDKAAVREQFSVLLPEVEKEFHQALTELFHSHLAPFVVVKSEGTDGEKCVSLGVMFKNGKMKERFKEYSQDCGDHPEIELEVRSNKIHIGYGQSPENWGLETGFNWNYSVSSIFDSIDGTLEYLKNPFLALLTPEDYSDIFSAMIVNCKSRICMSLMSGDAAYFLTSVNSSFNQPIKISLLDGTSYAIEPLVHYNLYLGELTSVDTLFLDWSLSQLKRNDYPIEVQSLPFDTPN